MVLELLKRVLHRIPFQLKDRLSFSHTIPLQYRGYGGFLPLAQAKCKLFFYRVNLIGYLSYNLQEFCFYSKSTPEAYNLVTLFDCLINEWSSLRILCQSNYRQY